MELEKKLLIIISAISSITSIAALFFAYYFFKKKRELERDKLNYEKANNIKKEFAEQDRKEKAKNRKKTAVQIYLDHIIDKFQYLDFTGLNALLQNPLKLEQIYVKLKTHPQRRIESYETVGGIERQEVFSLSSIKLEEKPRELLEIIKENRKKMLWVEIPLRIVILGHPGSGKTTLMKWIALQCARRKTKYLDDLLPIFIPLKDLGKDPDNTFRKNQNIKDLISKKFRNETNSTSFFEEYFKDNRILFLFDGLDEVADEEIRREVIQWIQKQNFRKNSLIITSRFSGIQAEKGLKFKDAWPVYCVQDFDIEDIEFFLENWYKNVELAMEENSEAKALQKAEHGFESLIQTIKSKQYEKLRELAVNPLLLTIIAIVHRTRAILPKERHKLYEECVKVMIELWNVANKKLNISFSIDNSINNLSKIAVYLMKENHREASLKELESILPEKIESQPVSFFLKEMMLKAGLLYKSEGQYGFLHLTFQEYLAAWNFSKRDIPEEILEYRDQDYWTETFKLFVNISNTRRFFNTVLEGLETENYWQQMSLWENCLRDIAIEDTQQEMELKFAGHILKRLPQLGRTETDEEKINQFYTHYPIFKHNKKFPTEAWTIFSNPQHPFVQSIGAILLSNGDPQTRDKFVNTTKSQIDNLTPPNSSHSQIVDFISRHGVSFLLLIVSRKKLSDIQYTMNKLKKNPPLIKYLALRNVLGIQGFIDIQQIFDNQAIRYFQDLVDILDIKNLLDIRALRNLRDNYDVLFLINLLGIQGIRNITYTISLREGLKGFYLKFESKIQKNSAKISQWADQALDRLHGLQDEELLKYFPGTTVEELREFRESKT